jgi:hypothetical protein
MSSHIILLRGSARLDRLRTRAGRHRSDGGDGRLGGGGGSFGFLFTLFQSKFFENFSKESHVITPFKWFEMNVPRIILKIIRFPNV